MCEGQAPGHVCYGHVRGTVPRGSPAISRLLDETREFALRAQRRYDDTDLILSTIVEHGYGSDKGRRAVRLMNRLLGRFEIANEDFL